MHPLALASPALSELDLPAHGVHWIYPDVQMAHPLDDGRAGLLARSVSDTAAGLGRDGSDYFRLMGTLVDGSGQVTDAVLSPQRRHKKSTKRHGCRAISKRGRKPPEGSKN